MDVSQLIERMRCPVCASPKLARRGDEAACGKCGNAVAITGTTVNSGKPALSAEWEAQQEGSVERYQDEHYEEDETVASIFGGFVATNVPADAMVLDVGCGLFPHLPAYVRDLRIGGYVGVEPLTTPVERDFVCLAGAVAENLPLKDESFDAALLATSLDHIMDVDAAMSELRRVVRPQGRIYFWVGLHDPEVVARAKSFHSIFYGARGVRRAARIAAAYAEYGWFMLQMWKRRRNLARGVPLDHAHCRYYTEALLREHLARWHFRVDRWLLVPGTNAVLVDAVPA